MTRSLPYQFSPRPGTERSLVSAGFLLLGGGTLRSPGVRRVVLIPTGEDRRFYELKIELRNGTTVTCGVMPAAALRITREGERP